MEPAIDCIVFDLDGTLVDTAGDITVALNHALVTLGRPGVDPAEVRSMIGHGGRALLERALGESGGFSEQLVQHGLRLFLDHYAANIAASARPFPNLEPVLDRLAARGFRLGICTNKTERLAHALIEAIGWSGRFAAILGADSRPWRKPDPRHLHATIAAAGGVRALFVGDSPTDAETARAAGVPLILYAHGYSTEPLDTLGADAILDDYAAFEAALAVVQGRFSAEA
jgi:phosphoglycolate phosphatase